MVCKKRVIRDYTAVIRLGILFLFVLALAGCHGWLSYFRSLLYFLFYIAIRKRCYFTWPCLFCCYRWRCLYTRMIMGTSDGGLIR